MEARVSKAAKGFGKVLEILGETPVASKPGEGALDHPAARQDDEAPHVVAPFDDLDAQRRHLRHLSVNCQALLFRGSPSQIKAASTMAAPLSLTRIDDGGDVGNRHHCFCRWRGHE
jgi:hypothetical protein